VCVQGFRFRQQDTLWVTMTPCQSTVSMRHCRCILVCVQGFRFRQQDFPTADHLVRYFQKHVNDDVTQARQRGALSSLSSGVSSSRSSSLGDASLC